MIYISGYFWPVERKQANATLSSNVKMLTFKAYNNVLTFKSKVAEIVLNAHKDLGNVYLASWDHQYFLAHRIVLVCIKGPFK